MSGGGVKRVEVSWGKVCGDLYLELIYTRNFVSISAKGVPNYKVKLGGDDEYSYFAIILCVCVCVQNYLTAVVCLGRHEQGEMGIGC